MKHLEIEMKTLLNQDEYKKLQTHFSGVTPITQKNYYLDTPDFYLRKHKIAMRIRTFENSAELTIKIPQKVGNMEYNQDLSLEKANHCLKECKLPQGMILDELTSRGLSTSGWVVLGCLTTVRYEKQTPIGLMALDQSQYFDIVDYELELEVEDGKQGSLDFQEFLQVNKIHYKKAPSKLVRFIENMKKY
ncbi:CYTH domain-containing protein [Streptococcus infantis]|uniref:CYTH domain-containing protein n=1 Tax=Streptococcus infantis TaxID=68892 RepID=UPI0039C4CD29